MTTADDIRHRLAQTGAMGWGPARSAQVAEAAAWSLDVDDLGLRADAHLALADAYAYGNEGWKAMAPFAWCLAAFEEHPELLTGRRLFLFEWRYKWIVECAADNPRVPVEQVRRLMDGLEGFYRAHGASMHTVHGAAVYVDLSLGDMGAVRRDIAAWRATGRDRLSDCVACDPERQVIVASAEEDWERAVASAVPVLSGELGCSHQPANIQSSALLALLASGRPKAAWDAHVRSYRFQRLNPNFTNGLARHMQYLALSGHVGRAVRVLRESLPFAARADSAFSLLLLLRGAAVVLREAVAAGRGDEELGVEVAGDSPWCPAEALDAAATLSQAQARVRQWALDVAGLFDERNGNGFITSWTARELDRPAFSAAADAFADAGIGLLEAGEQLPEGERLAEDGTVVPAEPPAPANERLAGDDDAPPYPAVDTTRPAPLAGAEDALERYAAAFLDPGDGAEGSFVVDQACARGLGPQLEAMDGRDIERFMLLTSMRRNVGDHDGASQWLREARGAVAGALDRASGDPGAGADGYCACVLRALGVLIDASLLREARPSGGVVLRDERVEEVRRLADTALACAAEDCGPAQSGAHAAAVSSALSVIAGLASSVGDYDCAGSALEGMEALVGRAEHRRDAEDLVRLNRARVLLERGRTYQACAAAYEVVRGHDPCPPVTAMRARKVIADASDAMAEFREAIAQLREIVNVCLAVGMPVRAASALRYLGEVLLRDERRLECAEVVESALGLVEGCGRTPLEYALRETLCRALMGLGEHQGVFDNSRELAQRDIEGGDRGAAASHLRRAAEAAEAMEDRDGAVRAYTEAACLHDGDSLADRVLRGRCLRDAARTAIRGLAQEEARLRLDEARALMEQSRAAIAPLGDDGDYSSAYEMGAWHDQYATLLAASGEFGEAVEHCEAACAGYMVKNDLEAMARPLHCMLWCLERTGDTDGCRAVIARIRQVYAAPRWKDQRPLRYAAVVEQRLEGGEL